ncbi:MAG: DUF4358 domain-containing protein [Erysipelotrichaceae bacterium]
MKKLISFLCTISILLTACSSSSDTDNFKTVNLEQLATTIQENTEWPSLAVLTEDEVFSLLGLPSDLYEDQYVGIPLADVAGYRLIMIEAKTGKLQEIKKILNEYIKLAKQQILYPTAVDNLDNALELTIGNYYFVIVSQDNDEVKDLIEDAFD